LPDDDLDEREEEPVAEDLDALRPDDTDDPLLDEDELNEDELADLDLETAFDTALLLPADEGTLKLPDDLTGGLMTL